MQNKKLTMWVMATVSLGAFALILFLITNKQEQNLPAVTLVGTQCAYASDHEAYNKMVETGDEKICACIRDGKLQNTCRDVASDAGFYKKALSDLNADLCGNIKDQTSKESCTLAVKDGIENAAPTDPGLMPEKKPMLTADYEKMQKENPTDVANLLNLAMAYGAESFGTGNGKIDMAKINKALAVLEEAKKIEPNNAKIYTIEGYIDNLNSQNDQALVAYGKSLALDANNIEVLVNRAGIFSSLGRTNEAIADLEKAAERDMEKIYTEMVINIELCGLYAKNANHEKATEKCTSVINGTGDEASKAEAKKTLESLR